MNDLEVMGLRLAALYTSDREGRLLRVNEPGGAAAPRFHLGRSSEGQILGFRADLTVDLVQTLTRTSLSEFTGDPLPREPSNVHLYLEALAASSPVQRHSSGPAYRFPAKAPEAPGVIRVTAENADVLSDYFEEWLEDPPECQPFMALVVRGKVVSVCASVRATPDVHEAGVETHPSFRGNDYAAQVAVAWAAAVCLEGATPVYSTSWDNTASQAVARKLDLLLCGVDFQVT